MLVGGSAGGIFFPPVSSCCTVRFRTGSNFSCRRVSDLSRWISESRAQLKLPRGPREEQEQEKRGGWKSVGKLRSPVSCPRGCCAVPQIYLSLPEVAHGERGGGTLGVCSLNKAEASVSTSLFCATRCKCTHKKRGVCVRVLE